MSRKKTEEEVIIVDQENNVVGTAPRSEMRKRRLIHRATFCLVYSRDGKLFVQKRTPTKDIYPSCWEIAAGGVVAKGEGYEESMRRELEEELGIRPKEIEELFDFYYEDPDNALWGRVYKCVHEGPFELQKEEVVEGRFMTPDEIKALLAKEPFTPDSIELLKKLDHAP